MKNLMLLGAFIFFSHASAFAESAPSPLMVDGIDIAPWVEYLKKEVVTLESSVTIYNWSTNASVFESGAKGLAEKWAKTFWYSYGGTEGSYNMYGAGLYGAADPIVTYSYGNDYRGGNSWLMTEMELPVGFKMVDVDVSLFASPPDEIAAILQHFDCPTYGRTTQLYFSGGGVGISKKCQSVVKTIYKDILRIDGFAYSYSKTYFSDCTNMAEGSRAFVITNANWMTPSLVRYYTSKSTNNLEARARIQTLFLQGSSNSYNYSNSYGNTVSKPDSSVAKKIIATYLTIHPESQLKSSTTKCDADACTITIKFCEPTGNCEDVALPSILRPGGSLITEKEAATTRVGKLLWSDLNGKPKTSTIKTWMKDNIYSCSGKLPFKKQ